MVPSRQLGVGMCRRSMWLFCAWVLWGCSVTTVRAPEPGDIDRVRSGQASLVLFQVKSTIDGRAVSPMGVGDLNRAVRLLVANLGERGAPREIFVGRAPSEVSGNQGWQYLLLPPGTYYMLALPPGGRQRTPKLAFLVPSAKYGRLTRHEMLRGDLRGHSEQLGAAIIPGPAPDDLPGVARVLVRGPARERHRVHRHAGACLHRRTRRPWRLDRRVLRLRVERRCSRGRGNCGIGASRARQRPRRANGALWQCAIQDRVGRRAGSILPGNAEWRIREGRRGSGNRIGHGRW